MLANGQIRIISALPATDEYSGDLVLDGGAGIHGDVHIGGNVIVNGSASSIPGMATISDATYTAGTDISVVGKVITNTAPHVAPIAGTGISVAGTTITNTAPHIAPVAGDGISVAGTTITNTAPHIAPIAGTGISVTGTTITNTNVGVANNITTAIVTTDTTASTSTTTGSGRFGGGVGIPGNVNAGGVIKTTSTTDATSAATGSVQSSGGISCAKAMYAGTTVTAPGGFKSASGTFSLSSTPTAAWTIVSGTRGFITITSTIGGGTTAMAFFEWTNFVSNVTTAKLSNIGDTLTFTSNGSAQILVASTAAGPVTSNYFVTLL